MVRGLEAGDIPASLELKEAVASEGRRIGAEAPIDREGDSRRWRESLADDRAGSFVAVDDSGGIIGNIGIELHRFGVAEVGMWVAHGWRGRGVGSALLTAAVEWARAAGAHKVALQHWPTNQAAVGLYEKFGFVEEGRLRRHYRRRDGELWTAVVRGLVLDEEAPGDP